MMPKNEGAPHAGEEQGTHRLPLIAPMAWVGIHSSASPRLAQAGGAEPFEARNIAVLNPGHTPGPNLAAPEPAQAAHPMAQRFFTLSQAGKIFGKTARTMRWWADTGRVRTIKIGASRFVTEAEIQRLLTGGEG